MEEAYPEFIRPDSPTRRVGGEAARMPAEIVHAFGLLKRAAARANHTLCPERMTDEKLAKQIAEWNQGDCPTIGDCPETQNSFECEPWRCWLSWLRQETEEGEWLTEEDFEEWVEKMKYLTGENE